MDYNYYNSGTATPPSSHPTNTPSPTAMTPNGGKKNSNKIAIIIAVIFLVMFLLPGLLIAILVGVFFNKMSSVVEDGDKLSCDAGGSTMIVTYGDGNVNGIVKTGNYFSDYDTSDIRKAIEDSGKSVKGGLIEFGEKLEKDSDGLVRCSLNGTRLNRLDGEDEDDDDDDDDEKGALMTVGNDEVGYVDIMSDWNKVTLLGSYPKSAVSYDGDDASIEMGMLDLSKYDDLDDLADDVKDSEIFDLSEAQIWIGKNGDIKARRLSRYSEAFKEYTAYYIFENEDGKKYCVEIQTEGSLDDADKIMGTFRFKK